jgi:hypothetical protein
VCVCVYVWVRACGECVCVCVDGRRIGSKNYGSILM